MSTAMTTVHSPAVSWNHLPDELQVQVIKHLVQLARPASSEKHPIHVFRILRSLSLVNKKICNITWEVYHSKGVHLLRQRLHGEFYGLAFPAASVGHFVETIYLDIKVSDNFEFEPTSSVGEPGNALMDGAYSCLNQWSSIFYTNAANMQNDKAHTDWQIGLPNLPKLNLTIIIHGGCIGFDPNQGIVESARCLKVKDNGTRWITSPPQQVLLPRLTIRDVTKDAKVRFCPKTVNVKVRGFPCGEEGAAECPLCCTQNVADAVSDVFKRYKSE